MNIEREGWENVTAVQGCPNVFWMPQAPPPKATAKETPKLAAPKPAAAVVVPAPPVRSAKAAPQVPLTAAQPARTARAAAAVATPQGVGSAQPAAASESAGLFARAAGMVLH